MTGSRHRLPALALVTVTVLFSTAAAPARPAERSLSIQARTEALTPRFLSLTPRVRDLRPKAKASRGATSFTLDSDILFAFDEYTLSPDADAELGTVIAKLRAAGPGGTVTIVGYTDDIGKTAYNLALSRKRATSVAAYVTSHAGGHRLTYRTEGLGEADPVAPNKLPDGMDNPSGRQENRRVVITFEPR